MKLNRDAFEAYRNQLLAQTPVALQRLDVILPYSLKDEYIPVQNAIPVSPIDAQTLASDWAAHLRVQKSSNIDWTLMRGVRDTLKHLFPMLAEKGYQLVLPQDTYPVYGKLAQESHLSSRTFVTFPKLDLTPLSQATSRTALLISDPLVPAGQKLQPHDVDRLRQWLVADSDRLLIIDAVYRFTPLDSPLNSLLSTGQCLVAHSMTKGWLSPQLAGLTIGPSQWIGPLNGKTTLSPETLQSASRLLHRHAHLPQRLEQVFQTAWQRLQTTLQKIAPQWKPPETGYFSWLPVPFETLLQNHRILAIPPSVFGSEREDLAVITSIHEAQSLREGVAPSVVTVKSRE